MITLRSWLAVALVATAAATVSAAQPPGLGQLVIRDAQSGSPVRLNVARYQVHVVLQPPVALVQIDQSFYNPFDQQQEGQFVFNLPVGASVSRFAMYVSPTQLIEGELVERKRASEIYRSIVSRRRDPAILEQLGDNLFKMRVFPIFARDEKRILLDFTLPLEPQAGVYQFRLPLLSDLTPTWDFRISGVMPAGVQAQAAASVSHPELAFVTRDDGAVQFEYQAHNYRPETDLVLTFAQRLDRPASLRSFVAEPHVAASGPDAKDSQPKAAGQPATAADSPDDWSQRTATYFLAEIPPATGSAESSAPPPADVLVLADTSSSITDLEAVRRTVRDLVASLRPQDRVRLMGADVAARPLHEGWLQPGDPAGLQRLDDEFCLGKTDLEACLRQAVREFDVASGPRRRLVVYVGDAAGASRPTAESSGKQAAPDWLPSSQAVLVCVQVQQTEASTDYLRDLIDASGGAWFDLAGDVRGAASLARWLRAGLPLPERVADVAVQGARAEDLFWSRSWLPGEPFYLYGRTAETDAVRLRLTLGRGEKAIARNWTFPVARRDDDVFVGRLWAQRQLAQWRNRDQDQDEVRQQIVALSQEWSLLSPHTAFLVLESEDDYPRWGLDRRIRRRYWKPAEARPEAPLPANWVQQFRQEQRQAQRPKSREDQRAPALAKPQPLRRGLLDPAAPDARAPWQPSVTTLLGSAFRADPDFLRRHPFADQLLQSVDIATFAQRQTLEQFAAELAKLTGANVSLDRKALDDVGISFDTLLTRTRWSTAGTPPSSNADDPFAESGKPQAAMIRLSSWLGSGQISLRSGARLLLQQLGLTLVEEPHRLLITTEEEAESRLTTEIYPVADLYFTDRTTPPWRLVDPYLDRQTQVRRRLESKLQRPVTIECRDRPWADVVWELAGKLDDTFLIDAAALDDFGLDPQTPITASFREVPAKQALEWILDDLNLAYTLHHEAVMITTPERAESQLEIRVHSARGLMAEFPVVSGPFGRTPPGGWGMGGGMLGSGGGGAMLDRSGGMGGYFGGGAMGGMGGMGGFGGGMAGGAGIGAAEPPGGDSDAGAAGLSSGGDEASSPAETSGETSGEPSTAGDEPAPAAGPSPAANVAPSREETRYEVDSDTLIDLIHGTIAPQTWDTVGGPGSIGFFPYSLDLVFGQTREVHEQVEELLERLRQLPPELGTKSGGRPATIPSLGPVDPAAADFDSLIDLITSTVYTSSWDVVGGPGSIDAEPTRMALVVQQDADVQDEVAQLLTMLRRHRYEALHGSRPWEASSGDGLRPAAAAFADDDGHAPARLSDYPEPQPAELAALQVRREPAHDRWQWRRVAAAGTTEQVGLQLAGDRLQCDLPQCVIRTAGDTAAVAWPGLRLVELGTYAEWLRQAIDAELPWLPHRSNTELARLFEVTGVSDGSDGSDTSDGSAPSAPSAAPVRLRLVPVGLPRDGGIYLQIAYSPADGLPVAWESFVNGQRTARIRFAERLQGDGAPAWRIAVQEDAGGRELARWELVESAPQVAEIPDPADSWSGYVHLDRRAARPAIDAPLADALGALRRFDWAQASQQLSLLPDDRTRHPLVRLLQAWCLENDRRLGTHDRLVAHLLEVAPSDAPDLLRFVAAGNFPSLLTGERYAILSLQPEATRTALDCDRLADAAIAAGKLPEALQHVQSALSRGGADDPQPPRYRRCVDLLLNLSRAADAVATAQQWAAAASRSLDELAGMAELLANHAQREPADQLFQQALAGDRLAADQRYALLRRWAAVRAGVERCEKLLAAAALKPSGSHQRRECVDLIRRELANAAHADTAGKLAAQTADAELAAELIFRQAELTPEAAQAAALLWQLYEAKRLDAGRLAWVCQTWNVAGQGDHVIAACETELRAGRRLSLGTLAELAVAYRVARRDLDAQRAWSSDAESLSVPAPAAAPAGQIGSGGFF